MKKLLIALLLLSPLTILAQKKALKPEKNRKDTLQTNKVQEEKFEPITLYFVMLTKGSNRTQDSVTAERIQEQHMANIRKLATAGKLLVAGPFLDDKNWRGIFILKADSFAEAEQLIKTDPAVIAGRLGFELHPWMTEKNCLFK